MATNTLQDLMGRTLGFFGIDNNFFKLNDMVFEVVEDESDGYRSMLAEVRKVEPTGELIFFPSSIAQVVVGEAEKIDGYQLKDAATGHVWLEVGTDNSCDYYPCFVFSYAPDPSKTTRTK